MVRSNLDLNSGPGHSGKYLKSITSASQDARVLPLTNYRVFNLEKALQPDDLTAKFAPYYLDWLAHPDFDAYWQPWSIEDHYADIRVPSLTVAAWYDIFLGGSLRNYSGVKMPEQSTIAHHHWRSCGNGPEDRYGRLRPRGRRLRRRRCDDGMVRPSVQGDKQSLRNRSAGQDFCDGQE